MHNVCYPFLRKEKLTVQCNIRIGREGMPQDMDEARQGPQFFGPFPSREAATEALRGKGWYEPEKGRWSKLSDVPGDRSVATIESIAQPPEVRSCDQLW